MIVAGTFEMEGHIVVGKVGSGDLHGMSMQRGIFQVANINGRCTWSMHDWMGKASPAMVDAYTRSW